MGSNITTPPVRNELRRIMDLTKPLIEESDRLVKEAIDQEHPLLYAEALITQVIIIIVHTVNSRFFLASTKQDLQAIPQEAFQQLCQRLDAAAKTFARAGCLEGEIRAKLSLADLLDVGGKTAEAQKIAEEVRAPALAMGYEHQILRADEHLSGNTAYQKLMSVATTERDMDAMLAEASDEEMKRFAADCLEAIGLPKDRLPVVERDCFSMRDILQEQVHWCRHLDLIQDLTHAQSPQTHFLGDPTRWCICTKFRYKSNITTPDWLALIGAFKQVYCANCLAREPKIADKERPKHP